MSECNPTGTWFETSYLTKALDESESRTKMLYETKLSDAINKIVGQKIRLKGFRGWLLRQTREATKEDANKIVREDGFGWGSTEYWLRLARDRRIEGIKSLRQVVNTAMTGDRKQVFVGKSDMEYLN